MSVEYLDPNTCQWIQLNNATVEPLESNRYLVTLTVQPWVHLTTLDGIPLRIDGHESFRAWGTRRIGVNLVLDVLVKLT